MRATSPTNGSGSTADVRKTAAAFAADVSNLSVARRDGPSEVRTGMHMPLMSCICMHITAH